MTRDLNEDPTLADALAALDRAENGPGLGLVDWLETNPPVADMRAVAEHLGRRDLLAAMHVVVRGARAPRLRIVRTEEAE